MALRLIVQPTLPRFLNLELLLVTSQQVINRELLLLVPAWCVSMALETRPERIRKLGFVKLSDSLAGTTCLQNAA